MTGISCCSTFEIDSGQPCKQLLNTPGTHQERISPTTVRRGLHANDLRAHRPSIVNVRTPLRRQNSHQGARRHLNWNQRQWNNFVFFEESRFCQYRHDGHQGVWRRPGERHAQCYIRQHDGWKSVWAGITANFSEQTPDTFDAQAPYCMCANGGNTRY